MGILDDLKKDFEVRECSTSGQLVISGKLVDYWITDNHKGFTRVSVVTHRHNIENNLSFSSIDQLIKFIKQKESCENKAVKIG